MFQENLQRALLHVKGARGAMLIGFDGIPIASLYAEGASEAETQLLEYAVELAHMIRKFNRTALDRGTPPIEEMSTTNHHQRTLTRVVHGEYLLVLAMDPGADSEPGQQVLKLLAPWVEKEL
jgi:predicted regulator of Ras-like GTPase activity (Roadblock/LC7/MglB family)